MVLVGHSLGAGVAAALAVLLKDRRPDWSHGLKAYCYSAPGAVFRCVFTCIHVCMCTHVMNEWPFLPSATSLPRDLKSLSHRLLAGMTWYPGTAFL